MKLARDVQEEWREAKEMFGEGTGAKP